MAEMRLVPFNAHDYDVKWWIKPPVVTRDGRKVMLLSVTLPSEDCVAAYVYEGRVDGRTIGGLLGQWYANGSFYGPGHPEQPEDLFMLVPAKEGE